MLSSCNTGNLGAERSLYKVLLHILLYNIAPVFFLISLGYILGKKFKLDIRSLSKLSIYIFVPAIIFLNLYETEINFNQLLPVIFTVIFVLALSAVGSIAAKIYRYGDARKNTIKNAIMFYNSGNFGIPLISLVFANTPVTDYAVSIQIMIMISQNLLNYSLGFYNAARGSMDFKSSLKSVLKMPAIHAIIAALVAKAIPCDLRNFFLWPAVTYAGNAMIAVNLLILGIQLSLTKFELKNKDVYFAAFLRLCIGPVIGYLLILLLRLEGAMAKVLMISSGLPTAVNTVLIAAEFNNEPEFATQVVVVTTLFCLFTLPLVIYFAQMAF
jgi:predicted permease